MRFDLPAPLGPMTEVKLRKGPIIWCPLYDLKSHTSMRMRGIVIKMEGLASSPSRLGRVEQFERPGSNSDTPK